MNLRWRGLAAMLVLVLVIAAIAFAVVVYVRSLPFSPEAWADPVRLEKSGREAMARRLVREGTTVGKTRAEVTALLGAPEDDSAKNWEYWLWGDYMRSDGVWLVLEFGADGRVARASIRP